MYVLWFEKFIQSALNKFQEWFELRAHFFFFIFSIVQIQVYNYEPQFILAPILYTNLFIMKNYNGFIIYPENRRTNIKRHVLLKHKFFQVQRKVNTRHNSTKVNTEHDSKRRISQYRTNEYSGQV